MLLSTVMVAAARTSDIQTTLALLTVAGFAFGLYSSNVWAITQTLAGPLAAGKWTGVQNFVANLPGMFGLWFTGWFIQYSGGQYLPAFYVAAAFALVGAAVYLWLIGEVKPVVWKQQC